MDLQKLIEELMEDITIEKNIGNSKTEKSWKYEEGVLITTEAAELFLELAKRAQAELSSVPQANELLPLVSGSACEIYDDNDNCILCGSRKHF